MNPIRFLKQLLHRKKWKSLNPHNSTVSRTLFPLNLVTVGKCSYGPLEVFAWRCGKEFLNIGSYVSIASGVKFLLGGNHLNNTFTTYPVKVMLSKHKAEALSKGPIIVEDDVWIGMDAMILSGSHIGQGAIIGARSVVSGYVPPHSIFVGNPGKIIKKRFSAELIEELLQIVFNKLEPTFFINHMDLVYKELDKEILKRIKEKIEKT